MGPKLAKIGAKIQAGAELTDRERRLQMTDEILRNVNFASDPDRTVGEWARHNIFAHIGQELRNTMDDIKQPTKDFIKDTKTWWGVENRLS